jgi:hypothetical protein
LNADNHWLTVLATFCKVSLAKILASDSFLVLPSTKTCKRDFISLSVERISLSDIEFSEELSILSSDKSLEFSDFFVPENEGDFSSIIQFSSNNCFWSKLRAFGLHGTATKLNSKSSALVIILLFESSLALGMNQTLTVFTIHSSYKSAKSFHKGLLSENTHSIIS